MSGRKSATVAALAVSKKKIDKQGIVHTTAIPCRFLDIHNRSCRIYPHRLQVEEDCIKLTPDLVSDLTWLPEDCAYLEFTEQIKHNKIHISHG
ncbi:MAG: YkgJ family cysteine cluster protein [Desulfuromusa sp.]|nr:YkgJ family cysteine cluster protein [Desulfuromusa sp.]